jgi:hypothetical protein
MTDGTVPDIGHEPDRISTRGVLSIVGGLVAMILAVAVLTGGLLGLFEALPRHDGDRRTQPAATPTFSEHAPLDPHQPAERQALAETERQILHSYGWIDRDQGIARIPIERAMEIWSRQPSLPEANSKRPARGRDASPPAEQKGDRR